jgi:hypothetical protein
MIMNSRQVRRKEVIEHLMEVSRTISKELYNYTA